MCDSKYPCQSVSGPSFQQRNCIRPCNTGDTSITAEDQMERTFENYFDPFSKIYKRVNFTCYGRNYNYPMPTVGTGVPGNAKRCRPGKGCDCCPSNGNPNTNTINQFEAAQQYFEDEFNPDTNLYQCVNTICKNYNKPLQMVATQGTGAPNACKIGPRTKRRGQCRQLDNNNVASDFDRETWTFDNKMVLERKCRPQKLDY